MFDVKKVCKSIPVPRIVRKVGFNIQKYSPEILIAVGVVGTVASAVWACKATTKLGDILSESKTQIDAVHNLSSNQEMRAQLAARGEHYDDNDAKKDLTIIYAQTGLRLFKLYAPPIALGILSLGSIIASNDILRKRNIALAAAYATVDQSFKEYRQRVVDRFGERVEYELRHNVKALEIEEMDEAGNPIAEKKVCDVVDEGYMPSDYARIFDETNDNWDKDPNYNLLFLRRVQNDLNDILHRDGFVFLNDAYKMLGFPATKAGQVVGWVYDPNGDSIGDNYIDLGIYDIRRPKVRDFLNGYERSIILDFNVNGEIWHLMK